ncbi:unnamed protein product [Allacma fusca]|uniref:RING-type E3 ubiquitin transferase n=1 Tax=Allacma fusca TaxID=39272 RepID=A0A8J2LJK9_9HEXA|nr:unnamed protein product [Allacma fusca]
MEKGNDGIDSAIINENQFVPIVEDTVDSIKFGESTSDTCNGSSLLNDCILRQTFTPTDFTTQFVQMMKPVDVPGPEQNLTDEFYDLVGTVNDRSTLESEESEEIPVIPDSLCDRMTHGIFQDPVITPGGITYERQNIEDHLNVVGNFDPITHVRLTADELYPDHRMRIAVDEFISIHPEAPVPTENPPIPASLVAQIACSIDETNDQILEGNKNEQ